ncbi:MAG: acyl-CoA thioesterase [Pseudomonadota bacterium]|nr:acyl-CoA thioesterase [Pseudomonadota bacterium]
MDEMPVDKQPMIRVIAMPADANAGGDIFGGWIMAQVDLAGSVIAHRYVGARVVTVAVNSFAFHQPVFIGDLVSCYADVIKVGNTSITIEVTVFAERNKMNSPVKVTQAVLTYVAVDENRRPTPIKKL